MNTAWISKITTKTMDKIASIIPVLSTIDAFATFMAAVDMRPTIAGLMPGIPILTTAS